MILIQPNQEFQDNVIKYNRIDSLLAFGLFCIMCILYAILAVLESRYPVIEESRLAGSGINIFMIISTILLVKVRKEKFSSIGLYSGKWKQSCLIGLILALILFFNNCLLHIISGADFIEIKDITKLVIYFLTVALCEEIVFRGYIGTRLYGLIKNQYLVIMITGILFITMHFPYRMIAYRMTIVDLTINNIGWILDLFLTHIVLSLIYMKTNSLYGSIIPHWMSNLAYSLVAR
ncbi:CPBP family intramembrane glutamic endopeptidase [Longibaculum muris]|uniref:CPBP family intramembrane glutamic endopeptidase n=1 Tax=Longibaculum muris TaxID=1796628 RepID=UPI0022E1B581|nr:CPBP family intramembrane glutamic endopeptidase [Longibaculum muris]